MTLTARTLFVIFAIIAAVSATTGRMKVVAQGSTGPAPMRVHHVHLNSTNPRAAAAYYPKPFAISAQKTAFNGYEAVKTGNVYLLFTKVAARPQNELTGPQTSIWHFGWNTPDSRKYDERFRAMGLQIAQMWDAADGKLVDMSSGSITFTCTTSIRSARCSGTSATSAQPSLRGAVGSDFWKTFIRGATHGLP